MNNTINIAIESTEALIQLLTQNEMSLFADKYSEVLHNLKNEEYEIVFETMKKSFINPLGWSHQNDVEKAIDELRKEVCQNIDKFRVYYLYKIEK